MSNFNYTTPWSAPVFEALKTARDPNQETTEEVQFAQILVDLQEGDRRWGAQMKQKKRAKTRAK